jgi:hypothetical protein
MTHKRFSMLLQAVHLLLQQLLLWGPGHGMPQCVLQQMWGSSAGPTVNGHLMMAPATGSPACLMAPGADQEEPAGLVSRGVV